MTPITLRGVIPPVPTIVNQDGGLDRTGMATRAS
jgi:dihydrodipicolinate synthase/N-acetylneuraminate lyase